MSNNPQIHSVQIPVEVYENLVDCLTYQTPSNTYAQRCLLELVKQSIKINKCCRCASPATERTDSGKYYCRKCWWDAVNEDNPAPKIY